MRPPAPNILTVDVGTSSLKAVLYTDSGQVAGVCTRRYGYRSEQPGWAEGDPEEWWGAFQEALRELAQRGFQLLNVEAVCFTGQMHTPVLLDERGAVIPPTILWLDQRAGRETAELRQRLGLPPYQLNSAFTLPKLLWLHRHRPEVIARTRMILWPKDYLRFRLTGEVCTDLTEPGGAVLLNWEQQSYATERLALVGLVADVLPPIRAANSSAGSIRPEVARALGLNPEARVVVGMGDVAALYGAAPASPGRAICSIGSSSMIFTPLAPGQQVEEKGHRIHVYPFGPYPMVGGVSSTTGSSLVWAYDKICRGKELGISFETLIAGALEIEPGAAGLCFIPYLAGERNPYWSDDIRGGFYGLQLTHDYRHLLRAVMEGVAYSARHLLDICEEAGVPIQEIGLAGGGAATPGLPQILAEVCERDVLIYAEEEAATRVLYALCQEHLGRGPFEEKLLQTFDEPDIIRRPTKPPRAYTEGYRRYRAFAQFAYEQAETIAGGQVETPR